MVVAGDDYSYHRIGGFYSAILFEVTMDNPELIEDAEIELNRLLAVFHKWGLNYWQILRILLTTAPLVQLQAEAEYRSKLK